MNEDQKAADAALAQLQYQFVNRTQGSPARKATLYWASQKVGEMRKALRQRWEAQEQAIAKPEGMLRPYLLPAQPDAALSDEERELLGDWWDSDWPEDVPHVLVTLYATVERILAARAAQPAPAPEVSRGVAEVNIIQRIVNAWDCCATCAGGVLARHDREVKAEGLREAADYDGSGMFTEPPEWVRRWLRDRANRLVRDALGGER